MNINFQDAKEHFINKGYCSFNIKEFDLDFYNFLNEFLVCDDEKNLKELFHKFRFDTDFDGVRYYSPIQSFSDAKQKEIEFINNCEDISKITQLWYFENDLESIERFLIKNNHKKINDILTGKIELRKKIINTTNNILKYFYDDIDETKIKHDELQFSFYDVNHLFKPHTDGMTINLCSILIYLNKDYNKENGGLLLLNGEEVVPEIGMVALMDLSKNDINHGVTKVTSGPGRYAIFNFPKFK